MATKAHQLVVQIVPPTLDDMPLNDIIGSLGGSTQKLMAYLEMYRNRESAFYNGATGRARLSDGSDSPVRKKRRDFVWALVQVQEAAAGYIGALTSIREVSAGDFQRKWEPDVVKVPLKPNRDVLCVICHAGPACVAMERRCIRGPCSKSVACECGTLFCRPCAFAFMHAETIRGDKSHASCPGCRAHICMKDMTIYTGPLLPSASPPRRSKRSRGTVPGSPDLDP
jgi:hypothetical protein